MYVDVMYVYSVPYILTVNKLCVCLAPCSHVSATDVFRVSLCLADDTVTVLHNVIEPISFKADVQMALKPVVSDVKLDILGHLNKIKVSTLFFLFSFCFWWGWGRYIYIYMAGTRNSSMGPPHEGSIRRPIAP